MKTIISIIEVVMYNLFPAALAAPVITILKDIIPLFGIVLIRIGLYIAIWLQKFHSEMFQKLQQAKLVKLDDISWIAYDRMKKSRA